MWKRFYEWNGRRSSTSSTIRQSDFIRTRENGHEVADSGPGLRFTRCTMFLIVVIFQGVKSSFLVLLKYGPAASEIYHFKFMHSNYFYIIFLLLYLLKFSYGDNFYGGKRYWDG